jgi:hypothetical protein
MSIKRSAEHDKTKPNKANYIRFNVQGSEFRVEMRTGNLKKQSQFAGKANDVSSFMKGYYGNMASFEVRKNKANLTPKG